MARLSKTLFFFGQDIWKNIGFGNNGCLAAFLVSGLFSLLFIAGFYWPAFANSLSMIIGSLMGGGSFIAVSLLGGCTLGPILVGAGTGISLAFLSIAGFTALSYLVPGVAALLMVPNILSAASYLCGGIVYPIEKFCSCISGIFCSCFNTSAKVSNTSSPAAKTSAPQMQQGGVQTQTTYGMEGAVRTSTSTPGFLYGGAASTHEGRSAPQGYIPTIAAGYEQPRRSSYS